MTFKTVLSHNLNQCTKKRQSNIIVYKRRNRANTTNQKLAIWSERIGLVYSKPDETLRVIYNDLR